MFPRKSTTPVTAPWSTCWRKPSRSYAAAPAFCLHGQVADLCRAGPSCRRARRLAAEPRAGEGRARRDHDAQRAAVPGRDGRACCGPATSSSTSIRSTRRASSSTSSKDSGAEAIVILENFANTLQQVIDEDRVKHVVVASMGDLLGFPKGADRQLRRAPREEDGAGVDAARRTCASTTRCAGRAADAQAGRARRRDDIAFLQYTGGTTGVSKGAVLTAPQRGGQRAAGSLVRSPALEREPAMPSKSIIICALPLYHIFALTVSCLLGMRSGAHEPADPQSARHRRASSRSCRSTRSTCFPAVNTLFNALLNNAGLPQARLLQPACRTAAAWRCSRRSPTSGWRSPAARSSRATGCRETSPVATCNPIRHRRVHRHDRPAAAVHRDRDPRRRRQASCRSASRARSASAGPQVMAGYWNRPDETAKVMTPTASSRPATSASWTSAATSSIVDRKKDMILVSGFNVYPNEIEDVIAQHPGVLECAAIGVPDEQSGEAVKVFVVQEGPGADRGGADASYCQEHLTGYKRPEVHRVPRRAAEDQRRQDPAARAARREEGSVTAVRPPATSPGRPSSTLKRASVAIAELALFTFSRPWNSTVA